MTDDVDALVAELEKLEKAATPRPWWWREDLLQLKPMNISELEGCAVLPAVRKRADYAFIAAIRNALPELLQHIKDNKAENEKILHEWHECGEYKAKLEVAIEALNKLKNSDCDHYRDTCCGGGYSNVARAALERIGAK